MPELQQTPEEMRDQIAGYDKKIEETGGLADALEPETPNRTDLTNDLKIETPPKTLEELEEEAFASMKTERATPESKPADEKQMEGIKDAYADDKARSEALAKAEEESKANTTKAEQEAIKKALSEIEGGEFDMAFSALENNEDKPN